MSKKFFRRIFAGDLWIWWVTGILLVASLWFGMSASSVLAYQKLGSSSGMMVKHTGMLLMSVAMALGFSRVPPKYFAGMAPFGVCVSCVMLILVLFIGSQINGSSRWLSIGGITFQPSEIAKIALVLYVSRELSKNLDAPSRAFKHILFASAIICVPIMLENLSTFLLVVTTVGLMMIVGHIPLKYYGSTLLIGIVLIASVIVFAPYTKSFFPRAMTWHNRVERFIGGEKNEKNSDEDYQARQANIAVASGGLLGKGIGKSYIKNFLPMAFSDFIFAIILEEAGIWGMGIIIACYVIIMSRAISIARRCNRPFHMYTILGLAFMICLQALINMAVGIGLIPVTGQTLPLVSMGGSSNIFTGAAIGIMLSISIHSQQNGEGNKTEKPQNTDVRDDEYYEEAEAIQY